LDQIKDLNQYFLRFQDTKAGKKDALG